MSSSVNKARLHVGLAAGVAIAGLLATAVGAAVIWNLLGYAERSEWHAVGSIAELQGSQPQLHRIEQREFYLVWVGATPVALSTVDPHTGMCRIRWFEQEHFFADPCGGTVYLANGSYRNGPSPRSMDLFAVRMVDGWVEVNIHHVTLGQNHV